MRPDLEEYIKPGGIYTGAQVIALAEIPSSTFYHYVKLGRIPRHEREIDSKTVYFGHEILHALTNVKDRIPNVFFVKPKRGRPRKVTATS